MAEFSCLLNVFASLWAEFNGRVQSGACRQRLAITIDKCCDWVNNCVMFATGTGSATD